MTPAEEKILKAHNTSHERQAESVTVYDLHRFYFDYQSGERKYDYECGPSFNSLVQPIIDKLNLTGE